VKPPSVTDMRGNLLALAAMLATTGYIVRHRIDLEIAVPLLMLVTAIPILLVDVLVNRVHLRPSTGLDWWSTRERDMARIATKWVGVGTLVFGVLFAYWLFPEYHGDDALRVALQPGFTSAVVDHNPFTGVFYGRYYRFLWFAGFPTLIVGAFYFAWLDRYLVEPRDAYWHLGAAMLGQRRDIDYSKVADLILGWIIKGYFAALMYTYYGGNISQVYRALDATPGDPFVYWFDVLYPLSFTVDLAFTTMGYLVTLRIFDTHVRSAEPTMAGWAAAIMCYAPFFPQVIGRYYMVYHSDVLWGDFLMGYPTLKILYGSLLLFFVWMFSLTTVAFGCRFSNLTNRGTITTWTYSLTKHPAYVSKIAHFTLEASPFYFTGSWLDLVRRCLILCSLAGVYWVRARTEERHLSRDPDYVRYAQYMNQHSIFAWVGRLFPFMRYTPPPEYDPDRTESPADAPLAPAV
jgi:hypothetical protein